MRKLVLILFCCLGFSMVNANDSFAANNGSKCTVECPDGTTEAGIIRNGACEGVRGRSTCF